MYIYIYVYVSVYLICIFVFCGMFISIFCLYIIIFISICVYCFFHICIFICNYMYLYIPCVLSCGIHNVCVRIFEGFFPKHTKASKTGLKALAAQALVLALPTLANTATLHTLVGKVFEILQVTNQFVVSLARKIQIIQEPQKEVGKRISQLSWNTTAWDQKRNPVQKCEGVTRIPATIAKPRSRLWSGTPMQAMAQQHARESHTNRESWATIRRLRLLLLS